jgi:hypothetical protein
MPVTGLGGISGRAAESNAALIVVADAAQASDSSPNNTCADTLLVEFHSMLARGDGSEGGCVGGSSCRVSPF